MMTLMPGDVIATGTPSGVGRLESGDVCEVEIDGIGICEMWSNRRTEIMKFFIDTANLDEIRECNELGLIDGVTTNPSLLQKKAASISKSIWQKFARW